jgi:hypothetical protein
MTFVEQSRLRPARWAEASAGLGGHVVRLLTTQLAVCGGVFVGVALLRWLPGWLLAGEPEGLRALWEVLAAAANVLGLVLEVVLVPLLAFALLLGPILIVEGCSAAQALREWWRFVRGHLSLIFLYETLAASLALITSLPLLLPVVVTALEHAGQPEPLGTATRSTVYLLGGLALTPCIAFLSVANVFIYLNLRYQRSPQK